MLCPGTLESTKASTPNDHYLHGAIGFARAIAVAIKKSRTKFAVCLNSHRKHHRTHVHYFSTYGWAIKQNCVSADVLKTNVRTACSRIFHGLPNDVSVRLYQKTATQTDTNRQEH